MEVLENGNWVKPVLDFTALQKDATRDEEILRQRKEQEDAERLEMVKATGIPERYWHTTFDTHSEYKGGIEPIKLYAKKSKSEYCGVLVILGENGTGKTSIVSALLHVNSNGQYIDMPTLEIELECSRDFSAKQNKADVLAKYTKPAILVLDEIGRFLNQQAERQALYYILNARYNKRLNTILVSNLNKKEFGEYIGNATADRIAEKRVIVELTGVSYRKQ
jgi:DNA replication protein DnaC